MGKTKRMSNEEKKCLLTDAWTFALEKSQGWEWWWCGWWVKINIRRACKIHWTVLWDENPIEMMKIEVLRVSLMIDDQATQREIYPWKCINKYV